MGNKMAGGGLVAITAESIRRYRDLNGGADLVEKLYEHGFDEVSTGSDGSIDELSFETEDGWWAQKFLHELADYVEPGSFFAWFDYDDCVSFVEDFGRPETIAIAWQLDGAHVQRDGCRAWTAVQAASTLEVGIAQPLGEGGEPLETEFALELVKPDGTRIEWSGTASELWDKLSA